MNLKTFPSNNSSKNPFTEHITNLEFKHLISEGFELGKLDCYANLIGNVCYTKSFISSIGWIVNLYITENGIAVDHDYECGGNSSHTTFWFKEGVEYTEDYDYSTNKSKVAKSKYSYTFEDAWNEMITLSTSY